MQGVHVSDKKHKCLYCDYQHSRRDRMEFHQNSHLNIKASCQICYKTISTGSMSSHMRIHMESGKKYQCEYCNKYYSQMSTLRRHQKVHTGSLEQSCPVCTKGFVQLSHLKLHLKTVHGWAQETIDQLPRKKSANLPRYHNTATEYQ